MNPRMRRKYKAGMIRAGRNMSGKRIVDPPVPKGLLIPGTKLPHLAAVEASARQAATNKGGIIQIRGKRKMGPHISNIKGHRETSSSGGKIEKRKKSVGGVPGIGTTGE